LVGDADGGEMGIVEDADAGGDADDGGMQMVRRSAVTKTGRIFLPGCSNGVR